MTEEAEDQQNTWHDDFTTASQWEIFIARLEEAIYDWKLPQVKPVNSQFVYSVSGSLIKEESNLFFSDVEFILTHYYRKVENINQMEDSTGSPISEDDERFWGQELMDADILDETGDGQGDAPHPIERWFGVHRFLILAPAKSSNAITSESQGKLLLSSVQIAISNSHCPVPIFVQLQQPKQFYFLGAWEGPGIRTEFNMVHLRSAPPHCRYLTGLLDVLKGKLASATTSPSHSLVSPVQVSARLRFCLKDWPMSSWTQSPPDLDLLQGQVGVERMGQLPFGAESDTISEIHLLAEWRCLPESVLVDRDGYSDLAPSLASRWSLRAILSPPRQGLLAKTITRILNLCTSTATQHQLLGDLLSSNEDTSSNIAESLSLLTETRVPSLSKLVPRSRKQKAASTTSGPIPDQMLMNILYFLFPDAEDHQTNPYPESFEPDEPTSTTFKLCDRAHMKSAPNDSLVWRLAVIMALVVDAAQGGLRAGAHLWHEVTQELRFRWEHGHSIPGLVPGYPDTRSCLLFQKLQMLNYCMERRREREKRSKQLVSTDQSDTEFHEMDSSEEEDDEFYECDEDQPERRPKQQHSLWNQPEGRLSRHGNIRLLETGDHLYIPITQEPPPKTEDQRHEDAEVLIQLGSDAAGSELRAQLMSPLLLSDMEAFKAANPGSCLGDFVRWYSPRDWLEEENKLSNRMLIEGNTWQELWTAAKPVPAARQKRLFDDTREAEKVLHFLESRKPADAFQLLLPVLLHAVMMRLEEEWQSQISPALTLTSLQEQASKLTYSLTPFLKQYERFVSVMANEEIKIGQWMSLQRKFCENSDDHLEELNNILCDLLQQKEVEVPGGPSGSFGARIKHMFVQAQRASHLISEDEEGKSMENQSLVFPTPSEREFLLRVKACVPSPSATPSPQRMYAVINDDSFRLAAAFSHDTIFF